MYYRKTIPLALVWEGEVMRDLLTYLDQEVSEYCMRYLKIFLRVRALSYGSRYHAEAPL